jgi:AcrR family transcriptional regulator
MTATDAPQTRAYDMGKRTEASEGTRRRIAEAAGELFKEKDYDLVTLTAIARAAGVSHQTVLNHFESKAGVLMGTVEVIAEQMAELQDDAVAGDLASIVHATCDRYEVMGDANARWAALSSRVPEVNDALETGRLGFEWWLIEMLGEQLPPADEAEELERVLRGVHAAMDVYTWKLLRRDMRLSQERTEDLMTDLVLGVLARHRL